MSKTRKRCAYCGEENATDDEHVFPKSLYPESKRRPGLQLLTVPACKKCNMSWQDDETHFRNMLVVAGKPNAPRLELWDSTVFRSFEKKEDGQRRMKDLIGQFEEIIVDGEVRHKIYPAKDERVVRVMRKIVRGLCHHHELATAVTEKRIWVDVWRYPIQSEFYEAMTCDHREPDIVEYCYSTINSHEIETAWLITFFNVVPFIALVSIKENGFVDR
jgi:hypothetical protein